MRALSTVGGLSFSSVLSFGICRVELEPEGETGESTRFNYNSFSGARDDRYAVQHCLICSPFNFRWVWGAAQVHHLHTRLDLWHHLSLWLRCQVSHRISWWWHPGLLYLRVFNHGVICIPGYFFLIFINAASRSGLSSAKIGTILWKYFDNQHFDNDID